MKAQKVTGLAFKAIFDSVINIGGHSLGNILLAQCGLKKDAIGCENYKFSAESYYNAWSIAEKITHDPLIGFHTGCNIHPSDLGLMGYVIQNCKDINQAMRLIIKTNPFGNDTVANKISIDGNTAIISFHSRLAPSLIRHWVEMKISAYLRMYHVLTNNAYLGIHTLNSVSFQHSCPGNQEEYKKYFQCDVKFSQPETNFIFSAKHFSDSVYKGNPNLFNAFIEKMNINLGQPTFATEVKLFIKQSLPYNGVPTLKIVAKHFGISESTAKRRLLKEGCNYANLCQVLLENKAKEMLSKEQICLTQVACYLGYSAPSAFSRAFKQWTGITIKEFRKNISR